MNKVELFNAALSIAIFVIGFWTSISWMHKQIYIFKYALELKKRWDKQNIKCSLLECFWRVKYVIEPKKFSEIKLKWGNDDD